MDPQRSPHRHLRALRHCVAAMAIAPMALVAMTGGPSHAAQVDTALPVFSHPTNITNPLFPVSAVPSIVLLGEADGERTKFEITRLALRKTIDWNGQHIDTIVSQFTAFNNGRIHESALDYFAQADDGSVWYLGEDVSNYDNGVVVNHNGTWLAGRDGPGGMIMPAHPVVGDMFHSENIPGIVFEEDTVTATGLTVDTPSGPVGGAIRIREVLMDGTREDKVYAPGYGQLTAIDLDASGSETLALAVPTDARPSDTPDELATIIEGADDLAAAAQSADADEMRSTVDEMQAAWRDYQAGGVPALLDSQLSEALQSLSDDVDAGQRAAVRLTAVEVGQATLDVLLIHRPPTEIDLGRVAAWATQVGVDAAVQDQGAVAGDVASIETTWMRVASATDRSTARRVDRLLMRLRSAADHADFAAASRLADKLRAVLEHAGDR
jgi:hypothetical protein